MICTAVSYRRISRAALMPLMPGISTSKNNTSKRTPASISARRLHGLCIGKQLQLHTPQGTVLLQKILHLMQQGGIVITESDPGHSKEILSEQKSTL